VALTAHAAKADKERFRAAGADDILVKPISRQGLRAVLAAFSRSGARPAPKPAPLPADLIDRAQLDDLGTTLGPEKLGQLVSAFRAELDDSIGQIASRIERREVDTALAEIVHHAAGSAAMFGAVQLRGDLAAIENLIRLGDIPDVDTAERLRAVWSLTDAALPAPATEG
jgi:CheY-like chemotaxis protein